MNLVDDGTSSLTALRPRTQRRRQPTEIILRAAELEDAARIAQIGAETFTEVFLESVPPEDIKKYLDEQVNPDAIGICLQDPTKHFIVSSVDGTVEGFAQLTEGTTEPCLAPLRIFGDKSYTELQRIYIDKALQGIGLGQILITAAEDLARKLGFRTLFLGVWEGNFKALAFYESVGYKKIGSHDFAMGNCVQTDFLLWKEL